MILLCGIPSESPLALVRGRLGDIGVAYAMFHQRRFDDMDMWFEVDGGEVGGELRIGEAHRDVRWFPYPDNTPP